jgi:hypothetical protein
VLNKSLSDIDLDLFPADFFAEFGADGPAPATDRLLSAPATPFVVGATVDFLPVPGVRCFGNAPTTMEADGVPAGELRSRLFLEDRLPAETAATAGVRTTSPLGTWLSGVASPKTRFFALDFGSLLVATDFLLAADFEVPVRENKCKS